jgi:hypothetical protein
MFVYRIIKIQGSSLFAEIPVRLTFCSLEHGHGEKYIKGKWDGYLILRWWKVCEINKYVNFTSNVIITTKSC